MRRNSNAHLVKDYSMDDNGTKEVVLTASISVLKHLLPAGQSRAALGARQAENIGNAIEKVLQSKYLSPDAAKVAATTAGIAISVHSGLATTAQLNAAVQAGRVAGQQAGRVGKASWPVFPKRDVHRRSS